MKMSHLLLLITIFVLAGCATGKDSILFVTKTSIAIDVDTNPMTFDVGYGRQEGSIAPVMGNGEVLPLMSSISSDGSFTASLFGSGVAQNFGVGNAAKILSRYIGSTLNPADSNASVFDTIIENPAAISGNLDNGRRYFFGTKTNFGFTVGFVAERAYTPDSIALGYKRKEFASVPIMQSSGSLAIPSLLATSGNSASASDNSAGFNVSQFYATGYAANFLAAHPVIRNAVISSIMKNDEVDEHLSARLEARKQLTSLQDNAALAKYRAREIIDNTDDANLQALLNSLHTNGVADSANFDPANNTADLQRRYLKKLVNPGHDKQLLEQLLSWIDSQKS